MTKAPRWDRTQGRPEPIRALNRILEKECGEPLVALSKAAPAAEIHRATTIPYVRQTVAEMVQQAALSLPEGYRLAVSDAWRPFERQAKIVQWMTDCAREAFPGLSHAALRRKVCRWVAPVDQKAPPGHCTGAAVDVVLIGPDGEPADVTSPFSRFQASPTYVIGLSKEAAANRSMLVTAMLSVGFSNCRDEYWHYSYGDAGWAVRLGKSECVYGLALLDERLWRRAQDGWDDAMIDRENPFLDASV
jgi:D-alanyl-D-alanine dipeptidase